MRLKKGLAVGPLDAEVRRPVCVPIDVFRYDLPLPRCLLLGQSQSILAVAVRLSWPKPDLLADVVFAFKRIIPSKGMNQDAAGCCRINFDRE
jgi:hypothetical protein